MKNQELIDNFPPKDENELFDVLQFVKKAPFEKDYWQTFKKLYKLTEIAILEDPEHAQIDRLLNLAGHLICRIDQENIKAIKSPFPTHATMRYMKRRGRRFLRKLAGIKTEHYVRIAQKVLTANAERNSLDFENQWISADITLRNSRRAFQKGHGQGEYIFQKQGYHLHHKEEHFPDIWDKEINVLRTFLDKNLPYEIQEFAVKILQRNEIKIKKLSEERLLQFFNSPSVHLKRLAVDLTYQTFTSQGLKPELYAGLWLYSNRLQKQKVLDIASKRPKLPQDWQKDFGKYLTTYTFNELKQGNNQKRVVDSLEFIENTHEQALKNIELLPYAELFFNSKSEVLQNLAVLGAKRTKPKDILAWLQALGEERTDHRDALYQSIKKHLAGTFKQDRITAKRIETFVLQASYYACDFGWAMSEPLRSYTLYYLWNMVTNHQNYRRKSKEVYLYNSIISPNGTKAFLKYYSTSSYYLNYISDRNLAYILQHGTSEISDFIIDNYTKAFKGEPLYHLRKIALFPEDIRNKILESALKGLENTKVFGRSWYLDNIFHHIKNDSWLKEATFKLIEVAEIDLQAARNIINATFSRTEATAIILDYLDKIEDKKKRDLFIFVLSGNTDHLLNYAEFIPQSMLIKAVDMLSLENLLLLTTSADDKNWAKLQKQIYQQLLSKAEEKGFWKNILERVTSADIGTLSERLLEDKQFFALFEKQKDIAVLDITDPTFEDVLLAWAKSNAELFEMSSGNLFKICIHKLAKLRRFGLNHAQRQGLTLIFALRLFESDLPDAVNPAKTYFENLNANSGEEREAVLALIDSPNKQVRTFGLDFIGRRKEHFNNLPRVLEFLAEHSDSVVLDFVAEEIAQREVKADFVKRFDKEVLRMKNRSRSAKEKVKNRVAENLDIDNSTLLELAQSKIKKDAEWAIFQLTKKALAGKEVEGFTLES